MSPKNELALKSSIAQLYEGKSLLLTGAGGYLGVVVLELLLRHCPGIRTIYILLREKKGVRAECRRDAILKKKIFRKIRENDPESLQKVQVVAGDCASRNLGLSSEVYQKLLQEVTIVYHMAASISFLKPLRFMLAQNVVGTLNIIKLCRELQSLDCLIYTSTAYSNSNRSEIEEQIYRLPFPAKRFLSELKNGNDERLNYLVQLCQPSWPNYYTFSKCLAENLFLENSDLPTAIIRPSIIVSNWKGSLPGYIEQGSGLVDISIAVGKGFVRVLNCDPKSEVDLVPVDIVANTHIVSSWSVMTGRSPSQLIVNCITSDLHHFTMGQYSEILFQMTEKHPLPKSYQKPSLTLHKNQVLYWMHSLIEHYIPAYCIDQMLYLSGRKPKLMSLYRFFDISMKCVKPFLSAKLSWHAQNIKTLEDQLLPEDKMQFSLDYKGFSIEDMSKSIPNGAPFYEWDIDQKPFEERKRVTKTRYMLTTFIKTSALACICMTICTILITI